MPKIFIQREIADNVVMGEAMRRLEMAGHILASKIEQNLIAQINPADTRIARIKIKNGYTSRVVKRYRSRPAYVTGKYAGKWWTARDAGELLRSVRVVTKKDSGHRNVWVIVGNSKAYYSAMFEYSIDPARGKKFYRPALASSRSKMKSVIENG
jgi:hypothetical protein